MKALALALCASLTLAACNRNEQQQPAAPAPAASAASPPASSASAAAPQPLVPQQVVAVSAPDEQLVSAGSQLASQGGGGAVTACAGCHGASGEGNAQANFPRLAGMGRLYLQHQLESYANGSRKHPVMQPIAAAMSDAQRRAAAAFYASRAAPAAAPNAAPRAGADPVLAVRGDDKRQIQACANCHGPQGVGDAAANPYLAGQHAGYLTAALAEWKSGDRTNDPSGQMPQIAKALTDEEARALVAYYASQPPPAPRNAQAAPPTPTAPAAAMQSGPASAPAAGTTGGGTEQGAPTTGGAQGQGAGGAATGQQGTPNR